MERGPKCCHWNPRYKYHTSNPEWGDMLRESLGPRFRLTYHDWGTRTKLIIGWNHWGGLEESLRKTWSRIGWRSGLKIISTGQWLCIGLPSLSAILSLWWAAGCLSSKSNNQCCQQYSSSSPQSPSHLSLSVSSNEFLQGTCSPSLPPHLLTRAISPPSHHPLPKYQYNLKTSDIPKNLKTVPKIFNIFANASLLRPILRFIKCALFTFSDTIWPLSISSNFEIQINAEKLSYFIFCWIIRPCP